MKARFILTIDTETFRVAGQLLPFETHHYAESPQGSFGVPRIMEICDRYDVKATFFTDVYMHHHYGEADVADLCQRIHSAGHDLQLHAHTSWFPDSRSGFMNEFPLDRQIAIIAEGRELIEKWTGKAPVAFRAGAYGANLNTIHALRANRFIVDSSYFPLHRNCELSRQLNQPSLNFPFLVEGIQEIPVTTYWLMNSELYRKNSKIDFNACSWKELRAVVGALARSELPYIVLFLHSFSFIYWDPVKRTLTPKLKPLKRFESLLGVIRDELGGEFVTMGEVAQQPPIEADKRFDMVPSVSPFCSITRVLTHLLD